MIFLETAEGDLSKKSMVKIKSSIIFICPQRPSLFFPLMFPPNGSLLLLLFLFVIASMTSRVTARSSLDTLLPLEDKYQTTKSWIDSEDPFSNGQLLGSDAQEKRRQELYGHLFGRLSPWNQDYVQTLLTGDLRGEEDQRFVDFSKAGTYYGEDSASAIPYPQEWLSSIKENSNLSELNSLKYDATRRGITTKNLAARLLPTDQHAFENPLLPGEGDTFDYLQMSAVWVGTPVYILAETRDRVWDLVLTPDFIAWVKSEGIALTDENFLQDWSAAASKKLVAITKTATPLQKEQGELLSLAYVGACFPQGHSASTIMVPNADQDHHAKMEEISMDPQAIAPIPLSLTPHHMADIMETLIGRPYGWGGMDFNNDCSAELKNLFLPFGIYLPRHSSDQMAVGQVIDKSADSYEDRLSYLVDYGKPFLSLIYIGKYPGEDPKYYSVLDDTSHQPLLAMTYQNLWGLRPASGTPRRAIIGRATFFPLLLEYPEDNTLLSLANRSLFQISDLSQFPSQDFLSRTPAASSILGLSKKEALSTHLKSLMSPEDRGAF